MKHEFWRDCWANQQIGFHLKNENPHLVSHIGVLGSPGRVLVPLCGKSLDMVYLAAKGFQVEGVEFVEQAAAAFFAEAGVEPIKDVTDGVTSLRHGNIRIWVADMFALSPAVLPPVDAIYDRAALVALQPETRAAYVAQLQRLSRTGARLLLVTFEHDMGQGPPFSVTEEDVERLLGLGFSPRRLDRHDIYAQSPRFQERGATFIFEAVWAGVRGL